MKLLTTEEVAALHGVSRSRIYRLAKARGVRAVEVAKPDGRGRPSRLWTQQQALRLKPGERGRPRKAT